MTVVTRNGKSALLMQQLKYDIALPKRMFSPDPEHPSQGGQNANLPCKGCGIASMRGFNP
jgi:hypothetical protein